MTEEVITNICWDVRVLASFDDVTFADEIIICSKNLSSALAIFL